jgi:hypothetical protein
MSKVESGGVAENCRSVLDDLSENMFLWQSFGEKAIREKVER